MARHRVVRGASGRLVALRWALVAVVVLGGGGALVAAGAGPAGGPAWPAGGPAVSSAGRLPAPPALSVQLADGTSPAPAVPAPVQVRIPVLGVDSRIVPVAVAPSGELAPPDDTATAGWFAQGTAPGGTGPAVVVGHVDSWRGPGVFFALHRLVPGDAVLVDRADGSTVSFTVTAVDSYAKDAFPTARVYAPTSRPELRLITCGGTFDRSVRSYEDNVVVYATAP